MNKRKTCRWGILSTAQIARKNWDAIHNADNATLVAVASRVGAKAQEFIDSCNSQVPFPEKPRAIGGYEALLAADDIDAVYIPLPTGLRKEWVIKAAHAGKHVLCEKPCALNAADLGEMLAACEKANVQFMDGVMFMHSTRLDALRETLDAAGCVGDIRRISSQFSFLAPDDFFENNIRANAGLEPAGCLGDLGWYTIRIALWAMKYELPESVTGRLISSVGEANVPTEFSGELVFKNGVTLAHYSSFRTELEQWAIISGTSGHITLNDFVQPYHGNDVAFELSKPRPVADICKFTMERHTRRIAVDEYATNHPTSQETNMIRTFSALALSGNPDPHWPEIAHKTQRLLDASLKSARNNSAPVEP